MALYSFEIEKHVIGGLLLNPDAFTEIDGFINDKSFFSKLHGTIYSCFRSSFLNSEKIDKVLLAQKIKDLNISFEDNISIFEYLDAVSFTQITSKGTIEAAQKLAKFKALRDTEQTCDKIKNYINKNVSDPLDSIVTNIDAIYGEKISSFEFFQEPEDIFSDMYEMLEDSSNDQKEEIGLVTPFPEFNRLYGGMRDGNVYAIASRPGEGKTTFLNYVSAKIGEMNNCPVLQLDTEMTTDEIKYRTAAAFTGVPLWYLETGKWRYHKEFSEKVRANLKNAKGKHKVYHYYVGNKTVDEVCSIIRRWFLSVVGRGNKALVCYDYLKLTGEKLAQNWAEHQALGEKVDKLKKVITEFRIPLLTAVQVNRTGENRGRQSNDVTDDGSAIAQSDRLQWFATYLGIFRRKTEDELLLDGPEFGTHKLIEIKARYQGKDAAGHLSLIKRMFPDGKAKYVNNYINYAIDNFAVRELGSLKTIIERQHAKFKVQDSDDPNGLKLSIDDTL